MLRRDATYYTTGYSGRVASKAPFYKNCVYFDKEKGDFNDSLIDEFNGTISRLYPNKSQKLERHPVSLLPKKVLIINASHDNLPTSYETMHVFRHVAKKNGWSIECAVVNTRNELQKEITKWGPDICLISQCVDKKVYNTKQEYLMRRKGIVTIPGALTAPGAVFSDKGKSYRLLSENHTRWDLVARYKKVTVRKKDIGTVAREILDCLDWFAQEHNIHQVYVKPSEGGGGLGGFRITKYNGGYVIPDLSKVTGMSDDIQPTFIDFEDLTDAKVRELLWIYSLFESDESMKKMYLQITLKHLKSATSDQEKLQIMREYLISSETLRHKKIAELVLSREIAQEKLTNAITLFEKKFKRRYIPLVNEHIDFGLWGLRAHFRFAPQGPVLETIYARIFQLAFTKEGVGYVGADNISNKQTGELEIKRLCPINEYMIDAIGGRVALFETLCKGVESLHELNNRASAEEKGRIPLRLQLDLAAVTQKIGEGNADTARGLCLASRWRRFIENTSEWFIDCLGYYSWRKKQEAEKKEL
ncbi:hypothetical protein ACFL1T_01400 [Chlamydiota bacterium]